MDFAKHIKSLLIANDKLCIPGLGTFITRYKPAEIVPGLNYIKPPSKEVSFDPGQKKDDTGILASYIARQERISIQDAYEKIKNFTDNIIERINNDRGFGIKDIGSFSLSSGKIIFRPELTGNLNAESYGLSDVSTTGEAIARKSETVQAATQPAPVAEVKKPEPAKTIAVPIAKAETPHKAVPVAVQNPAKPKSGNGKWVLIGVSVPVIALLICVFLILPNTDFFSELTGSKQVVVTTETDNSLQSDVEKYIDTVANQESALKFDDENAEKEVKTEPATEPKTEPKTAVDDKYAHCKDFYIIAGSFQNYQLANRFRMKLRNQGYEAEILIKGDTNRVYIKRFSSRQEALKDLEQLQASGMNVWLLSQ